ncbi:MAG TPA: hypothetical protein ACFYEK_17305 [Candidatus Wunengus sp. YC60]|uniref:hypothetical protein n=1 Tax=Candidatus Wunengus sp. YC60 TaxID=3367697 RepID=UPI004025DF4E
MKKLFFLVAIATVFALTTTPALAAKPTKCATIQGGTLTDIKGNPISVGYDQWGYNYQAHMFNGLYDNFSRPAEPVTKGTLNLIMKWNDAWLSNQSCDGDSKLDRPNPVKGSGAWLTNHITGTYASETKYNWNVSGIWNFDVVSTKYPGTYAKTMTITQDANGNITGTGANVPAGYTWSVAGNLTGSNVTFALTYGAPMSGYVANFVGTIAPDGTMNGTWSDVMYGDSGPWSSSNGNTTQTFEMCSVSDFVKMVAVPADAYHDASISTPYGEGMWYESLGGREIGPAIWGDFAVIQEVSSDPCNEFNAMNYRSQIRSGLGNW